MQVKINKRNLLRVQTLQAQSYRRVTAKKRNKQLPLYTSTFKKIYKIFHLRVSEKRPRSWILCPIPGDWEEEASEKHSSYQYSLNDRPGTFDTQRARAYEIFLIVFAFVIYTCRNAKRLLKNWKSKGKRQIEVKRYTVWLTSRFTLLHTYNISLQYY